MTKYFIRRIAYAVLTVFIVSFISFTIMSLAPGDVVTYIFGYEGNGPEADAVRKQLGLDKPLIVRYFSWVRQILTGNFGVSHLFGPVGKFIGTRLPFTLAMMGVALTTAILFSIAIVYISARKKKGIAHFLLYVFSLIGVSMPEFWFAGMAMAICRTDIRLFPYAGLTNRFAVMSSFERFQFAIIPTAILTFVYLANIIRYVKTSIDEVLENEYIRVARSKGLSQNKVIFKHALKNAMIPIITAVITTLPMLISSLAVVETVFRFHGIGYAYVETSFARDYTLMMALLMLTTSLVAFGGVLADFFYTLVDPRIKYS